MSRDYRLSNVTKEYLAWFRCILDEMRCYMTTAELTDSISHNFIVQMIPHHQAAIEMSNNILRYTTNIPLQEIALQIVDEQTQSIEDMQAVLQTCSRLENCQQDLYLYQARVNQIMHAMFSAMEDARADNQINADFIREMIPHHIGAIAMAENALQYDICPELKPMLQAIITSQEQGIMQMKMLLRRMEG